jgi:hypothetical protein
MRSIWKQLQQRRLEVAAHPFFIWLNSSTVPLDKRFVFSPVMIDFIMSFADMNKWFLNYEEPKNELETGINQHTEEDRTHSRLFQDNWYTLKLGDTFDWSPGKTLWWLFDSSDAAVVRRFGMEVLDLTVNYPEPLVRFAMMEAIEICGDVFFANTAPIAQELSRKHGTNHHYYGHYHRERETGHLHTNETAFRKAELAEEQRSAAAMSVDRIFDNFLGVLDELLSYSQRAVADYAGLQQDIEGEYLRALAAPPRRHDSPPHGKPPPEVRSTSQVLLLRLLGQRQERLRNHPFLGWLRSDDGTPPVEKFRRFIALWGIDIVGYKDFNELVLRYPSPRGPAERAINRQTRELATHNVLYLQDWKALRMDKFLGWNMGETIAYYFLSEQTEVHRRNMAKVKKLAFRFKEPALRFWLMTALEASGEPLFETTAALARAVEADEGLTLNYWANRHHLLHPKTDAVPTDEYAFWADDLSQEQCEVARRMIETVFDNVEEQFELSHREALSAVFVREPASLPPPRVSDRVFARSNGAHAAESAQLM